jgi:hypothetical protein
MNISFILWQLQSAPYQMRTGRVKEAGVKARGEQKKRPAADAGDFALSLGGGVGVGRGIWASLHQLPELAFI